MRNDRPSPGCIILLAVLLFICLAVSLCVSRVGAGPLYQYSTCHGSPLRAHDGAYGYVYYGEYALPVWTEMPLPLVGHAHLVSLLDCRITVKDNAGMLYLDYLGSNKWTLPRVGYTNFLPLLLR